MSTFKSVSRVGYILWVDPANFWMSPQQIQHLFVVGRHLEDSITESCSGVLSFELCTEQWWLEVGSFRAYQSYKGAGKDQIGKNSEGFYPQSGHSSTEAPHDDDDSPLKSVCHSSKHEGVTPIYKSVSEMDSWSADSGFNFLLILTSFSFLSSLSSHRPLLRLLFLAHLRVFFFLSSSFCTKCLTFLPPVFLLLDLSFPFFPLVPLAVEKGCSWVSCNSSTFLLRPSVWAIELLCSFLSQRSSSQFLETVKLLLVPLQNYFHFLSTFFPDNSFMRKKIPQSYSSILHSLRLSSLHIPKSTLCTRWHASSEELHIAAWLHILAVLTVLRPFLLLWSARVCDPSTVA